MAKRCYSLISIRIIVLGFATTLLVSSATLLTLFFLWENVSLSELLSIIQEKYLWYIFRFSVLESLISVIFSVIPAILLARAFYRRNFMGREILLRFCSMTLVTPMLVAVFGIISVYGRSGWLSKLCSIIGIHYSFTPYGLQGIIITNVFFNLPLATRVLLNALQQIPNEHKKIAAQLGIKGIAYFRFVEFPWLRRQIIPISMLIFILCFTSFSSVMVLGGSPHVTTIELAIFQALNFDFNPSRAALLALVQIICCLIVIFFTQYSNTILLTSNNNLSNWYNVEDSLYARFIDVIIIILALLLIIPPLFSVLADGFNQSLYLALKKTVLWQATFTSLFIALISGFITIIITIMLLWSARELRLSNYQFLAGMLEISGMLILTIPSMVLATSFCLLLKNLDNLSFLQILIIIFINTLMAVPYAIKILKNPLNDIGMRYNQLCMSLNITGWNRFFLIEFKLLKLPIVQALAFSCILSLGDFGIVAFFGNEDFTTLTFYLYQQIGSYHTIEAAVTALWLLIICFTLFTFIQKLSRSDVNSN